MTLPTADNIKDVPTPHLITSLEYAKNSESEWKAYKQIIVAEIHSRLPVPADKQSQTHSLPDGTKVECKASRSFRLADKELANSLNLHQSYPEAFPKPISFSKTGFNKLSDSEQKKIELSGVLVSNNPSLSVTIKERPEAG